MLQNSNFFAVSLTHSFSVISGNIAINHNLYCRTLDSLAYILSQTVWVFNYCDVIGPKATEVGEMTQSKVWVFNYCDVIGPKATEVGEMTQSKDRFPALRTQHTQSNARKIACVKSYPTQARSKAMLAREIEHVLIWRKQRKEVANGIASICHVIQDNELTISVFIIQLLDRRDLRTTELRQMPTLLSRKSNLEGLMRKQCWNTSRGQTNARALLVHHYSNVRYGWHACTHSY